GRAGAAPSGEQFVNHLDAATGGEVASASGVVEIGDTPVQQWVGEQFRHLGHEGVRKVFLGVGDLQDRGMETLVVVDRVVQLVTGGRVGHSGGDGLAYRIAIALIAVGGEK